MSLWKFADALPELVHVLPEHRVQLGEGDTPLVRSIKVGPDAGLSALYFKLESCNPTGSYKDRFAAAAVSDMVACQKRRCLATSSGNTGSALAAYCAAAGIECSIAIIDGAPQGKIRQMQAYGARLFSVHNFGHDHQINENVMKTLHQLSEEADSAMQVSAFKFSPLGMSGVQSVSYELVDQLPDRLDHVFCQAGGGGMTWAVARGFSLLEKQERLHKGPAVHCVQPEGNNTIAGPLREGKDQGQNVQGTSTISGLQVSNVLDGNHVIADCRKSGGNGFLVSDEEIYAVQARLAREEGLFCEPAAAVSVAGALQAHQRGEIQSDDVTVCLITGTGFKDERSIIKMTQTAAFPTLDMWQDIPAYLATDTG